MGQSSAFNFGLVLLAPLPSIGFYVLFLQQCEAKGIENQGNVWSSICQCGRRHPWYLVNVLFLLNVDILFWIIGILQHSFWLIDPYWTIIPVLIGHFFQAHPLSQTDTSRSLAITCLIWLWSIRLTYSYLRREDWKWGEREDWRFAALRKQYGKQWWWLSFFLVFISQHIFLIGLTLPIYTVYQRKQPSNMWDNLATILCILGTSIAHVADTELYSFMRKNAILKDEGLPTISVLKEGLWYCSRHPNYFGEQLFWWGLSGFAWNVGQGWAVLGTLINSCCLAYVTALVERKMLQVESRAREYREYQQSTSVLIPWFKWKTGAHGQGKSKSS